MRNKIFVGFLAILTPPIAFLYLSRPGLSLFYLGALLATGISDYLLELHYEISGLGFVLTIIAAFHSLRLVNDFDLHKKKHFYNYWWGALSIPFIFILIIFLSRSFFYEPFSIPSESMSPTLNSGDHILVQKLGYGTYGSWGIRLIDSKQPSKIPKAGEIFALYPPQEKRIFVERIIGLPGDEIELLDATLKINGTVVSKSQTRTLSKESIGENTYTVKYITDQLRHMNHKAVVPNGHYFVMGDNRNNSLDSRSWGLVPEANIVGKVILHW